MIATLHRCFRTIPRQLQLRWAAVAAIVATASLAELVAAISLYAFLGGSARIGWIDRIGLHLGVGSFVAGFTVLVVVFIVKSLLGILGTSMRAKVIARSIQSSFGALVLRDLSHGADPSPGERSAIRVWRAMKVSEVAYLVVAPSGVTFFAETVAVMAVLAGMIIVAPVPAVAATTTISAVCGILLYSTRGTTIRIGKESHRRTAEVAAAMHSVFGLHREIRTRRREHRFTEILGDVHRRAMVPLQRHIVLLSLPRHVVEISFIAVLMAVVYFTRASANQEEFIAVLGVFAYSGFRLVPAANRILYATDEIRHHEEAVAELDARAEPRATDTELPALPLGTISLRDVRHRHPYATRDAVSEINLTIVPGERIGIIGESGAGKSTLIDLLAGLRSPTAGSVMIGGITAEEWLRRGGNVGLVPQGALLLDGTVRENIEFGSRRHDEDVRRAIDIARLRTTVDLLSNGERTTIGERGGRLSGGERQRIAIARAVIDRPDLLFLDEATSAIDAPTEREILEDLAREPEITIVIAAHRLRSLAVCSRIVVLQSGSIVDAGSPRELELRCAEFRRLMALSDLESLYPRAIDRETAAESS